MRATLWAGVIFVGGAAVLAWAASRWPDVLTAYLAPVWATGVAAYLVYLLTSFRHVMRSTGLLLVTLDEQLRDDRAILNSIGHETTYDGAIVGIPARRPYLSAWELFVGAQGSYQISDRLVRIMLRLGRKLTFLSGNVDELDAEATRAVRERDRSFDFAGRVGFIQTLVGESIGMVDEALAVLGRERSTLTGRMMAAQVLPFGGAMALLVLVLLTGSRSQGAAADRQAAPMAAERRPAVLTAGEVVRAPRFELTDARGAVRGVLSVMEDGGAGLVLASQEGEPRATVIVGRTGRAVVMVNGRANSVQVGVGVLEDGTPFVDVTRDGRSLWRAP